MKQHYQFRPVPAPRRRSTLTESERRTRDRCVDQRLSARNVRLWLGWLRGTSVPELMARFGLSETRVKEIARDVPRFLGLERRN